MGHYLYFMNDLNNQSDKTYNKARINHVFVKKSDLLKNK